ncbi:cytochrome P450 4V2-like [Dermacentor silvarum]|uniref:cytochrome P450 4V2-like n=1 Tax=Dermacentor silvarum TaxID=543639 RepID=UPI001896F848|nr:cytochrome P450 4V2-like [Dermacentor silvarum]
MAQQPALASIALSQLAAWPALAWTVAVLLAAWFVKGYYLPWLKTWLALKPVPGPWDWIPFWYLASVYWARRRQLSADNFTAAVFSAVCEVCKAYEGKTLKGYLFLTPIVGIHTPEAAQALLMGKVKSDKPVLYRFLKPWLGHKSLLMIGGDAWKTKRRIFMQAFHTSAMDGYLGFMRENADCLVAKIDQLLKESPGEPVVCLENAQKCALDIIGRFALGEELGVQKEKHGNYGTYFHMLTVLISSRTFQPWNWLDAIYNITPSGRLFQKTLRKIEAIVKGVMKNRKNVLQKLHDETQDHEEQALPNSDGDGSLFLDSLLLAHIKNPSYTLDEARKDADFMMFAGSDSSSCAISWSLYLLGLHPEKQRKVQQELDDVLGHDPDRFYTMDDLKRLEYMECCVKETLRLFPPFPFIGKVLDEDLVIDGYTLPQGLACFINIFSLHRNPNQFDKPEEYMPERFMSEENSRRHPYSYIPFSAGPKNCIGQKFVMMEVKVVLAKILTKFTIESTRPLEEVEMTFEIVLKAKGGLPVWFRRRHHL